MFANSNTGYVVGDTGFISKTDTGGATWYDNLSNIDANLSSVFVYDVTGNPSSISVWAVGEYGTILKAQPDGVTFIPVNSNVTFTLNKVYFTSPLIGWAVGDSGTILKSVTGGNTWTQSISGVTVDLNSIYFYDENYGFAVGDSGTILRSSDGGATWINQSSNIIGGPVTQDLLDIAMFPQIYVSITNEEITSQLLNNNTTFFTQQKPIVDIYGNTVEFPSSDASSWISVVSDGTNRTILNVDGLTGLVTIAAADTTYTSTFVNYNYAPTNAVYAGQAWAVGTEGTILYTSNIGADWTQQTNSFTDINLNAVDFLSQTNGFICGSDATIIQTLDGSNWSFVPNNIQPNEIQRLYFEGNIQSNVFLNDNIINSQLNIGASQRVQVQYQIRVLPFANPDYAEAGLNSDILGLGPNSVGYYGYENMGPINGDSGCWQAVCPNTVDGYVYAIPIAFVGRRNTSPWSSQNLNGGHQPNTEYVRLDLLEATEIVESDVLDVRHQVIIPSIEEYFNVSVDQLLSNNLQTVLGTTTGPQYGIELLQVDRVDGASTDGGTLLSTSLSNLYLSPIPGSGDSTVGLFSGSSIITEPTDQTGTATLTLNGSGNGYFTFDPAHYFVYDIDSSAFMQGSFTGFGTPTVTFQFSGNIPDSSHVFSASGDFISYGLNTLTYTPSEAQLVKVYGSSASIFYKGILDTDTNNIIESWDSGVYGYTNYATIYQTEQLSSIQASRGSNVQITFYVQASSSNLINGVLTIPNTLQPNPTDSAVYTIYTPTIVYNVLSEFNHQISSIIKNTTSISITGATGYTFTNGMILEITADVLSIPSLQNTRNGATVNFSQQQRSIYSFTESLSLSGTITNNSITFNASTGDFILGCSSIGTSSGSSAVCFLNDSTALFGTLAYPILDGTSSIIFNINNFNNQTGTASIQALILEYTVPSTIGDSSTGALIGYDYIPVQTVVSTPNLEIQTITEYPAMIISNNGWGSSTQGTPYINPIEQIPITLTGYYTDQLFSMDLIQFLNYNVDNGFIKVPVLIDGQLYNVPITLSTTAIDSLGRQYFTSSTPQISFMSEGLQQETYRKIMVPVLARVLAPSGPFLAGECVLVVFTSTTASLANTINGNGIAVYKIAGRPLIRFTR